MSSSLELISTACSFLSLVISAIALFKINKLVEMNSGLIQKVSGTENIVSGRDVVQRSSV